MAKTEWTFGVYAEMGKRDWKLRVYSLWYSDEWPGWMGRYTVTAPTRREAEQKAIHQARTDLAIGVRPRGWREAPPMRRRRRRDAEVWRWLEV